MELDVNVENTNENDMTLEQARALLKGSVQDAVASGQRSRAMEILIANDPNDPIIHDFNKRYIEYFSEEQAPEPIVLEDQESETQSEEADDLSMYTQNHEAASKEAESYTYEEFANGGDIVLNSYVERTEIKDEHNKTLEPEAKTSYMKLLFEAAKLKAETVLTKDKEFHDYRVHPENYSENGQRHYYRFLINDIFATDYASAVAAYKVEPLPKDKTSAKDLSDHIQAQSSKAREALRNMFKGSEPIKVKTDSILVACADAAHQAENFATKLKERAKKAAQTGFANLAASIQKSKQKLEEKAMFVSKNRYAIFKNIKGSLHDNAVKIGGNLAASTALGVVAATAGAPAMASAIAAYGAYHAVSAWVYPIIAEKRKISRMAKEQGAKALNPWKRAWKNVTTKAEGKKVNSYVLQGVVNTALGVVGGSVLAHSVSAASTAQAAITAAATARSSARMGRALTPAAAQLTDAGVSYLSDPHNKENASRARQTAVTALIGAGINLAMISLSNGASAENLNDLADNTSAEALPVHASVEEAPVVSADQSVDAETNVGTDNQVEETVIPEQESVAPVEEAPEAETTVVETAGFPKEYSPEMGISERQYNTLINTMEGTLVDAEGQNVTLDNAYDNLSDEAMQKYFPDMTKEQVLYKYNRLYAFMRRAKETTEGSLRELQTERRFWKYNDEMNAMMSLLGCGESIDEKYGDSIKDLFENKYNDLLTSGKGNNVLVGHTMAEGCEKDGGEWISGTPKAQEVAQAAAAPVAEAPVAEAPVVEETIVEETVVEETVVEEPVVEEPVVEEKVAEEPVVEEKVAEEPAAEEKPQPKKEPERQKTEHKIRKGGTRNIQDINNGTGAWRYSSRYSR